MDSLPQKLKKEPIIDALFEVRFTSNIIASEILPGFLYSKLDGNKSIIPLPPANIPKPMREADINFRFAPIIRVEWQDVFINISDHSISIGCKLPYAGWTIFKKSIEKILNIVSGSDIVNSIERYSIKYINLIPLKNLDEQVKSLNLDMTVAGHKLEKEIFQIRIEIPQNNFTNIIHFVSAASVKLQNNVTQEGVVVDIDSICNVENITIQHLLENFSEKLDAIHLTNKTIFFSCLREKTLQTLEADYAQ